MNNFRVFVDKDIKVEIAPKVIETWEAFRQDSMFSTEACGVLIGSYHQDKNTIRIMQCTEPLPRDQRTRYSFTLKDKGHQKVVDAAFRHSDGERNYIGTWHTHPERRPRPSCVDKKDWKEVIKRNPDMVQFVFVIVGTESISFFPKKGLSYEC